MLLGIIGYVEYNPDQGNRKDIVFLRGNLDYRSVAPGEEFPRYIPPRSNLSLTGNNGIEIFSNTAVFIPVLTARYSLGDIYDGKRIKDELALRQAVNRDSDESLNIYAMIMSHGQKSSPIVDDINDYRIESPMYNLIIGSRARFRNVAEAPSDPGE